MLPTGLSLEAENNPDKAWWNCWFSPPQRVIYTLILIFCAVITVWSATLDASSLPTGTHQVKRARNSSQVDIVQQETTWHDDEFPGSNNSSQVDIANQETIISAPQSSLLPSRYTILPADVMDTNIAINGASLFPWTFWIRTTNPEHLMAIPRLSKQQKSCTRHCCSPNQSL